MKKTACVVIPIYKEKPTDWETASFRQVLKVLSRYDIFIYTHRGLDLSFYITEAESYNKDFKIEYFDKGFFSSVKGYNRFCLTVDFYKRVSLYEYMLIYQLDAWVFRDELEYWCNKGYDYIGAPFFDDFGSYENGNKLWTVGNGGFSLRRTEFCMNFLSYKFPIYFHIDFNKGLRAFMKSCLKSVGICNTVQWYVKHMNYWINEDHFFTNFIKNMSKRKVFTPKIPLPEEAATFSFEQSPSYLYDLCGKRLPFGCHAFEKYEFDTFWKKHIIYETLCNYNKL